MTAPLVMLLGVLPAGAAAAPAGAPAAARTAAPVSGPVSHPQSDHLGSTIAAHESAQRPSRAPAAGQATLAGGSIPGMDVSSYQGNVDWGSAAANGARFAYVKATENTNYTNPFFAQQYNGSSNAGLIRGAYHFALPDRSSGAAQANYFVDNGGGWSGDGRTLPPVIDIEYNPYGPTCYGLTPAQMSAWVSDFVTTVHGRTSRWPVIYTTTNWWSTCTANTSGFWANDPLWVANYNNSSTPGTLPAGASSYSFWQFSDTGAYPGDQDLFNGSMAQLQALAAGPPAAPYHPLMPARVADTRPGSGEPAAGQTLGPAGVLNVQVAGRGGVPVTATAVVVNVTATNPSSASFFSVYPAGSAVPLASTLNFPAGASVPNLVEVGLGPSGQVSIYNQAGFVDAIVDVQGYVAPAGPPAGAYNALSPMRIADTRPGSGLANGGQTLGPAATVAVQVDGVGGVPTTGVSAVVLNVTATNTTATSYVTAYPDGINPPLASNLNFVAGQTVPNRVIVPVGADGKVDLYNYIGRVDTVVDVSGWYTDGSNPAATGSSFVATGPTRLADTRPGSGRADAGRTLGPGGSVTVTVTGTGGVPAGATAVVLNVTVTNTTGISYLTVYPTGQALPTASDLNWVAGDTRANLAVVRPGPDGSVTVYNHSSTTDVVVDVSGYYR